MFCSNCGTPAEGAGFCKQCGTPIGDSAAPAAPQAPPQAAEAPPAAPPTVAEPPPAAPQAPVQYAQPPAQYAQPAPPVQQKPEQKGFVPDVFSKSFKFLFQKPILLWGLSLLFSLLAFLAFILGLPIISIPIILVLQLGMCNIFLCGFRGQQIDSRQLFEGFGKGKFISNAAGMGWMSLWLLIWGFVPVMGVIKFYSYRFVPYIMLANPDITPHDALKKSMLQTEGNRLNMFLVDLIIYGALSVIVTFFTITILLFTIVNPILGAMVYLMAGVVYLAIGIIFPLLAGIIEAVFYDKISKEKPID